MSLDMRFDPLVASLPELQSAPPEVADKHYRMLVHSVSPLNAEPPLELLNSDLTPIERMFMRNNHTPPVVSAQDWSLSIDGLVRRPLTISYTDLRRLPTSSYVAVLECSGNGRKRFAEAGTPAEGVQWHDGAVANAEWIGVPIALLLERAGIKRNAVHAECWGGGAEPLARSIPLDKLCDDAMLAYAVNDCLLPSLHGGPVRLVVPGWGGINWVKWISRINLRVHESESAYNQHKYVLYDATGAPYGKVRELLVKSQIISIKSGAALPPGGHIISGFAWSAARGIRRVEISLDGGACWRDATLGADMGPRAWRRFSWYWQAEPGSYQVAARATDAAGNTQPMQAPFNRLGYLMNAVQCVPVAID